MESFLEELLENYGLEKLLELNDINPVEVLELLIDQGLFDVEMFNPSIGVEDED